MAATLALVLYYAIPTLITYILLYATYQVFLNPISRYPGPFLAKFSGIYNGYYACRQNLHLVTRQNQSKYGPVVRQGPNKLVFNSLSALKDIYKNDRVTKTKEYMHMGPDLTVQNIFTARDRQFHRGRRQLIGQALTDRFMQAFEPTMTKHVDLFLRLLLDSSQNSRPVDMTDKAKRLAMDIVGQLGFGSDFSLQTSDESYPMLEAMETHGSWVYVYFQYPPLKSWINPFVLLACGSTFVKYVNIISKVIKSRISQEKDAKKDLYSIVAGALDSGSGGLQESELWSEASFFLGAGGDTIKTTLAALFFYLSRYPECYEKLAHEIRSTFTSGREIHGPELAGCRYLRACIDESLRMSPPTPAILWREQVADDSDTKPLIIDGNVIPRGTQFGVNMYSILHKEEVFPDSFTFSPERWLGSASPEATKLMSEAFIPFLIGSRQCGGRSMAYLEASLVVAKVMWYFDFKQAPGELGKVGGGGPSMGQGREHPNVFQLLDGFTSAHEGPYLVFKARGNLWKDIAE